MLKAINELEKSIDVPLICIMGEAIYVISLGVWARDIG
jgi:hypothetical protein